jgi:hypothetical protein
MTARMHICDVPGCERQRERWQRICSHCFKALPRELRGGIGNSWKAREFGNYRQFCRHAGEFLAQQAEAREERDRRTFEHTARIMGEHHD